MQTTVIIVSTKAVEILQRFLRRKMKDTLKKPISHKSGIVSKNLRRARKRVKRAKKKPLLLKTPLSQQARRRLKNKARRILSNNHRSNHNKTHKRQLEQ